MWEKIISWRIKYIWCKVCVRQQILMDGCQKYCKKWNNRRWNKGFYHICNTPYAKQSNKKVPMRSIFWIVFVVIYHSQHHHSPHTQEQDDSIALVTHEQIEQIRDSYIVDQFSDCYFIYTAWSTSMLMACKGGGRSRCDNKCSNSNIHQTISKCLRFSIVSWKNLQRY